MASKLSSQLTSDPNGQKGTVGDFSHASKLFVDGDMRLAPKVKFLYHVVFDINTNALISLGFKYKNQNEIGMLVKKIDLPKFTIQTATLNQYNRKKNIQNRIDYAPVQIVFHDDSFGVTRQLWENYYNYYYADQTATKIFGGYNPKNSTKSGLFTLSPYGLDNGSTQPFFNKITIYQMSKGQWNSYALINPLITSWNHDALAYSENAPTENNMMVAYESVQYDTGTVSQNSPPGFGVDHYDTTRSSLTLGSVNNIPTTSAQLSGTTQTGKLTTLPAQEPSMMQALNNSTKVAASTGISTTTASAPPTAISNRVGIFPIADINTAVTAAPRLLSTLFKG